LNHSFFSSSGAVRQRLYFSEADLAEQCMQQNPIRTMTATGPTLPQAMRETWSAMGTLADKQVSQRE
jgi:hypothetical protein